MLSDVKFVIVVSMLARGVVARSTVLMVLINGTRFRRHNRLSVNPCK
jgi:hypothetical protein